MSACPTCGHLSFPKVYDRFSIRPGVNKQTRREGFFLWYRMRYVDDAPDVKPVSASVFLLTREGAEEMQAMLAASVGIHSDVMLRIFNADKARDEAQRKENTDIDVRG